LGWATHIVHHSPECYNLSVAYRLGITGLFSFDWVFFVPIAWLGFDPKVIAGMVSLNLLYQFWLHTELIPKLGWLEWVLNTPSHHRVHHGSNPLYLDRNYGGTLIVFDRLFGTFQGETPEIKIEYGLTEKTRDKSVSKILFMGWISLWKDIVSQKRFIDKIKMLFTPPGWTPTGGLTSESIRSQWIEKNQFFEGKKANEI
jgi:sterol desaturase/sphingolipid hydroxylase (fatty acid hydroxylase superfamily)